MKVAVDAMGGDYGPRVIVEGALSAARELDIEILLVGVKELIKKEFDRLDPSNTKVTIVNASEYIGMGEGIWSLRRKKRTSIQVGTQLVKEKEAEAFVSTGNTAAVVYISNKILGALDGVERPGLSLLVPTLQGLTLLIDIGANANCTPSNLVQFAVMGKIFMENILGLKDPRIALMNIGEERSKGNKLTKMVSKQLSSAPYLNFIGNVEGKDLYSGEADIIVSDGFTGNIALKASEGVLDTLLRMGRREIMGNLFAKIGYMLIKRNLKKIYKRIDYSEYGGAHLLGIKGVCIIGHGRSSPVAVKNAIKLARDYVSNRIQEIIENEIVKQAGCYGKGRA
jgi:glycerol-3-phosphate acyltransferase PlsX